VQVSEELPVPHVLAIYQSQGSNGVCNFHTVLYIYTLYFVICLLALFVFCIYLFINFSSVFAHCSQELLEAVERERNIRFNPTRNATIFHHPTLGDFELQHVSSILVLLWKYICIVYHPFCDFL